MIETLAGTLVALGTVFGWSFFSFWSAIPAGMALGLAPALVALTVTVSYGSGALLVAVMGAPLRDRVRRRLAARASTTPEGAVVPNRMVALVQCAWDRFGLIGLALLAPMTVGAQAGAVIGLGFGARPLPLVLALTAGAAAWAIGITLALLTGLMTLSTL